METKVIRITDPETSAEELNEAAHILREGGLVVFPTETVYGLGGNGLSQESAEKIYAAKGRPSNNPLIIHIHEPAEADKYAYTGDLYFRLAAAFMPGPLTVILPKRDCIPYATTGGLDTVAVRCPDHPIAHALLKECGDFPVAAPSANLSGKPSPTTARDTARDMDGRIAAILDGGACEVDEIIANEWMRIPHFYRHFYVYQYATGFSAAMALSKRILEGGEEAVADYLKFLSGGCSTDPVSLLKIAGVDMSTPDPVNDALNLFGSLIDELDQLLTD